MSLQPQQTLGEMTSTILTAIGEGGEGVAAPATVAMVQELIRRHQSILVKDAPWTINRTRVAVELPANQTIVDWPDAFEPGSIELVSARKATDAQYEWTLESGITAYDRSIWINAANTSVSFVPNKYDFLDGAIEVGPLCTEAITLYFQGMIGKASLVEDGDRPNCDSIALALKTEIAFRNARGGDFRNAIPVLMREYDDYIGLLKPQQGNRRSIVMGRSWDINDPARRTDFHNQRHWMFRNSRP